MCLSVGITGGRGIAGTVLVHKIAGAVAGAGASVEEVQSKAQVAADSCGTMGVALTTCCVPGSSDMHTITCIYYIELNPWQIFFRIKFYIYVIC